MTANMATPNAPSPNAPAPTEASNPVEITIAEDAEDYSRSVEGVDIEVIRTDSRTPRRARER